VGRFFIEFNEAAGGVVCLIEEAPAPFKLEGGSGINFTQLALRRPQSSIEFYFGFYG